MDLLDLSSVVADGPYVLDRWGPLDVVVNNGRHIRPRLADTILKPPIDEYSKFLRPRFIRNPHRPAQYTRYDRRSRSSIRDHLLGVGP